MKTTFPFEVNRTNIEINERNGYYYQFMFQSGRLQGMAEVLFSPVKSYDCLPPVSQLYRELGLQPDQRVAHLNRFYPNGQGIPDDSTLMRQGIGTAALELITADARESDVKGMHVFSGRLGMIRFMERNFEVFDPKPQPDGTYQRKYVLACKLI